MKLLFTLINLILLAAAGYLGHEAYKKISSDQESHKPAIIKSTKRPIPSERNGPRSPGNYQAIIDRNLFHADVSAERPKPIPVPPSKPLKPTKLNVKLWGTVTSGTDASYAIIEDQKKKEQRLYRIGESIQNATVKAIFREKIVLNVQGRDEVLTLERLKSRGVGRSSTVSRSLPRSPGIARPPSVRRIRLNRSQLEKALKSELDISNQAKVRPHFTDGRQDGIILTGVRPNSVYRRLGLRNGDIILGIDETDIQSTEDLAGIYQRLSSVSELTLKIKRRGRETTMNYTIE